MFLLSKSRSFTSFFVHYPALPLAITVLLGLALSITPVHWPLCIPLLLLLAITEKKQAIILSIIALGAFGYGKMSLPFFPSHTTQVEGVANFVPEEIKEHSTHFKKTSRVKGTITSMRGGAKRIPCTLDLPSSVRPLQAKSYEIPGTLEKIPNKPFHFKATGPWEPVKEKPNSLSLVEMRFNAKQRVGQWITTLYPNTKVAHFLVALVVGDLDDNLLRYAFGRLGLQHILAISGFHFGLVALFLGGILRFLCRSRKRLSYALLFLGLTTYYLFLGHSPSITRAYLAAVLYLIGKFGSWRTRSMNLFAIVLLLEIFLYPSAIQSLGFQLSFLATGAILQLFPWVFSWMQKVFPVRSKAQALALTTPARLGYLVCCFLRSTFSLNIAVHMMMIPVCLLYFGQFPLLSLAYNLFIPLGVSLTLFMLFLSFPLLWVYAPLGQCFTTWNENFTARLLSVITEAPTRFNLSLSIASLSEWVVIPLLLLLFSLPLLSSKNNQILLFKKN